MPNQDGTGPRSQGSQTGKRRGRCRAASTEHPAGDHPVKGRGRQQKGKSASQEAGGRPY